MAIEKKPSKTKPKKKGGVSKKRKFKPFIIPRYLVGSVPLAVVLADLKMYNEHRYNIFTASPKVDTAAPKMNPYKYLDLSRLADNARRLQRIDNENKNLLRKINLINRHGGKVDTFNAKAYDRSASKWYEHETKSLRIAKENREIYKRILKAQSTTTKASHEEFWKEMLHKMKYMCRFPVIIFNKRNYDEELRRTPSITQIDTPPSPFMDRPICYLSFKIDDGMKLGTVFVMLYADSAPVTCENFLAMCKDSQKSNLTYKNSIIHNVVKCQYMELGDVTLGNGKGGKTIYGNKFAEEKSGLRHTRPGVLSTIPVGNKECSSMFTITLREMPKFDNKHNVFGKVVKGFETILLISDLGKKVGKPNPNIRIVDCGVCSRKITKRITKVSKTQINIIEVTETDHYVNL